jgi:hypothetical protein
MFKGIIQSSFPLYQDANSVNEVNPVRYKHVKCLYYLMSPSSSILKTLLYHHRFTSPLTLDEIHLLLISPHPYSLTTVQKSLNLLLSQKAILKKGDHYYLSGLSYPSLSDPKHFQEKQKIIQELLPLFKKIPPLNFLAITGSVASQKPKVKDDIDLLLISSPNTLWVLRPLFLFSLYLKKIPFHQALKEEKKNYLCPNIILDSSSLIIPKNRRSLTTATDLVLMIPVFDRGFYHQTLLRKNSWVKKYLANAYHQKLKTTSSHPPSKAQSNFHLLFLLNLSFFIIQYLYMLPKIKRETVTLRQAFFHPPPR